MSFIRRFLWRGKMGSKYPELHQQQKSSNNHQSDQLMGKQVQQHQPIMGWGNEVLIAGCSFFYQVLKMSFFLLYSSNIIVGTLNF